MNEKPILPIDDIVDMFKFQKEIKNKYLDQKVLDDEILQRINKLFGVGDSRTGRVCDEYHSHSYECIEFYHPATAIVNRLTEEIARYKGLLSKIEKISKSE